MSNQSRHIDFYVHASKRRRDLRKAVKVLVKSKIIIYNSIHKLNPIDQNKTDCNG